MLDAALSLAVLAALALLVGAVVLYRRTRQAKQPLLMVVLALVLLVNVGIWTLPDAGGDAPLDRVGQGAR